MSKFKQFIGKTWVMGTAAAMILGSGALLASALNQSAFAATDALSASSSQVQSSALLQTAGGYTLVNQPTNLPIPVPDQKGGLTVQQIRQKYETWLADQTPGPQDLSAQQGAAYAAALLKQAYSADLTGYTATAVFIKGVAPNTDQWDGQFNPP